MIYDLKSWKDIEKFANQNNLFDNKTHWLLDIDDTLIEQPNISDQQNGLTLKLKIIQAMNTLL